MHRRVVSESGSGGCREQRRTNRHGRRFVRRYARENYFASEWRCVVSHHQSICAREWITDGYRRGVTCELVADHTGEIPFSVLSVFEVIGVVLSHFCRHAFSTPRTIDFGSASHGFSQISPGSMGFVFINEFQPLPGGPATATVGEIGRHHSEQCGMILLVDGQCELVPEISPRFFSHHSASCRSLREGRNSYEQHQQRCKRSAVTSASM